MRERVNVLFPESPRAACITTINHSNDDSEVAALTRPSTEDAPQNLIDFHDLHCCFTLEVYERQEATPRRDIAVHNL